MYIYLITETCKIFLNFFDIYISNLLNYKINISTVSYEIVETQV